MGGHPMNARSTSLAAEDEFAAPRLAATPVPAERDEASAPTPPDFAALMRRVEAEVYDIS
jgi:hypothetical protein